MGAFNHYRDNAITYKAQRDKNAETEAGDAAITDMQMRQRDVAALDGPPEGIDVLKLKNVLCVVMLPLVVVGCTSKQSVRSVREATTASGVDNAALPPTGRHRRTGLFHPQRERLITIQKQLEGTQKYINEQCR